MTNDLIPTSPGEMESSSIMHQAGQAANQAAMRGVFDAYHSGKSRYTLRRHVSDLAVFGDFLRSIGVPVGDLYNDPAAWSGVTWGLLEAFKRWQLGEGYAVTSINVRLMTARKYATLAVQAGVLDKADLPWLKIVKGYRRNEAVHLDEARADEGIETRRSLRRDGLSATKKWKSTQIGSDQARLLKIQPDTPRGRRDALLMCLMLEHGLRAGEVSILTVDDFDLERETFTFYRPKVDKTQTHKMTPDTLAAARAYLEQDGPPTGNIWRSAKKGIHGELVPMKYGYTTRGITKRVSVLGNAIGINQLSAHDCRHYWATTAARSGTPLDRMIQAGGWTSEEMALRYIEDADIANDGVRLTSA